MTEKTGRRRSLSRRTMLGGTAGGLGATVLAATPAHAQTSAPAASVPGSSPPGARYGDPAWWAQRKEEILEPALEIVDPHQSSVGPRRAPLPDRPATRRYGHWSQHHSQRLHRMRRDVPGR